MLPSRSLDCTDQDYARLHRPNIFSMLKASKRNIYEQCPAAEGSSWLGFHWLPRFEISAGIVQCMVSGQLCNCDSKLIKLVACQRTIYYIMIIATCANLVGSIIYLFLHLIYDLYIFLWILFVESIQYESMYVCIYIYL